MSGLLEQAIIIVFSLHLGEPLVLDLTMLAFISRPYIVLHHNFHFLCLIDFSEFRSGWQSCDSRCNDWLFWLFFLSWNLHVLPNVSLYLLGPWSFSIDSMPWRFQLLPFIIGSWMWMDNQGYFKASFRRRFLLTSNWTRAALHGYYHWWEHG